MADDEVRPVPEPRGSDPVTPEAPPPAVPDDGATPPEGGFPAEAAMPVSEPTMAGAGADLPSDGGRDEQTPVEPARPAQRSMMPAVLSAIGIVLIALLGYNLYLMANPPNRDLLPELQTEIGGLRQRIGALEARPNGLAPLDARLKTLDASVAQLSSEVADAKAVPPVAVPSGQTERLDSVDRRVSELDKGLAELRTTVAALPRTDLGPIEAKLAALSTDIEAVKASVAALPKVDLGPLESAMAALDGRLKPIETEFSAPKAAQRVTEARQEGSAAETRAAPLAVTAQAILQALDDGKPFAAELATLATLGADAGKVAALKAVADKGAPTRRSLLSGFAAVRDGLVVANVPKVTGTVLDRMMASAQGLVQVRPAGTSAGSEPDAIASRIAADLDRDAFDEALTEWDHLPEASKAVSNTWAEGLRQRVTAEAAARAVASGAIAAIGSQR